MVRVAVLLVSRNRPDLVDSQAKWLSESVSIFHDLFVIECGTDRDKLSEHSTLWYADPEFRGKVWGHSLAIDFARKSGKYDYYFVLMNDLVFDSGVDVLRMLVDEMEREPLMAILSPTNIEGDYPSSAPREQQDWHAVSTCDYLAFMMRASALDQVGFLNPSFQYCWGAIHELSYKLYSNGWFVAYSDKVSYRHLGGSTYGHKGTNTISRDEYQSRAKSFAHEYFISNYGDNWDEIFWSATQGHGIEVNTFSLHKEIWSEGHVEEPCQTASNLCIRSSPLLPVGPHKRAEVTTGTIRLHLGCGPEKREGWINIDTQPSVQPDIVSSVVELPMFYSSSVDVIEANHLFEHLTYDDAFIALNEWARILKPNGELFLEMPDFEACVRMLGQYKDPYGFDLGLIGIYGFPPAIAKEGMAQVHKWGWTRSKLIDALRKSGFDRIEFGPISQTWRTAAKYGRDLRLRAVRVDYHKPRSSEALVYDSEKTLIVDAIRQLDPWFFPIEIDGVKVIPGFGSHVPSIVLENSTLCRISLLVDEVAKRFDLRGKSVLELACNCGFWSAKYAGLGATHVVGVEGRERYIEQAKLYWGSNNFLPRESWEFINGNVADIGVWDGLRAKGPFDLVLCAGILYHVKNYEQILSWAAGVTRSVLVVDTRVQDGTEEVIIEPGELHFNSIEETRTKVVPNRAKIIGFISSLGFETEVLPVCFPSGPGVNSNDDYSLGHRVTIYAERKKCCQSNIS
jgi:2-polyprenyl-3-methyl-5-hydroxy-6-metoxy-1,4-benzoquinol methylase